MDRKELLVLLNKKKIFSCFSNLPIEFVDSIKDESALDHSKVYSDGMFLIDFVENAEDDISRMYCELRTGRVCNMEDFYSRYGAFDKDGGDRFIKSIKYLIKNR